MSKGITYAVITAIMWGFLAVALKLGVKYLSPVDLTWLRFTVAFVCLMAYYAIWDRRKIAILKNPPIFAVFAAIFLGLNYLGFISGVKYTTPSITQIFIQIGPLLLAVAGFIIFREKAKAFQLLGIILAFGGYAIFYNEQILVLADDIDTYKKGVIWTLFGGVTWALYAVLQKFAVRKHHPMQLNLIIFGLPALVYSFFVDFGAFLNYTVWHWALFIFLGLNTLIAYGCLSFALKHLAANKVSVIITSNPLITFVVMAILGLLEVSWIAPEKWSLLSIIGAFTVLSGVLLTVSSQRGAKTKIYTGRT